VVRQGLRGEHGFRRLRGNRRPGSRLRLDRIGNTRAMGSFGAMGSCRGGCRVAWFSGPVIRRLLILMRGMRGRGILLLLRRMLHRVVL
jgi:hypothetical protein